MKRVTQDAYAAGERAMEARLNELQEQVAKLNVDTPVSTPKIQQPEGQVAPDPRDIALSEFAKNFKSVQEELKALKDAQAATLQREREREISDRVKRVITATGLENPDAVLLLLRGQMGVEFIPSPADPRTLIAVSSSDHTKPFNGTFSTAEEVISEWASTPDGKRFRPFPDKAQTGAGMSGQTGSGISSQGVVSDENLRKSMASIIGVG